jgi:hypothetical protein
MTTGSSVAGRKFSSQKKQTEPADNGSWTTKKTSRLRRKQGFTGEHRHEDIAARMLEVAKRNAWR